MLYKIRLLRPNGVFEGLIEDYPHYEILKELLNIKRRLTK